MRETGWGRLAVRDAHVHFFSHRFFGLLTGGDPAEATAKLGWETPPEAPEGLAERWIGEMDRQGVDAAALIASLPGMKSRWAGRSSGRRSGFTGGFW